MEGTDAGTRPEQRGSTYRRARDEHELAADQGLDATSGRGCPLRFAKTQGEHEDDEPCCPDDAEGDPEARHLRQAPYKLRPKQEAPVANVVTTETADPALSGTISPATEKAKGATAASARGPRAGTRPQRARARRGEREQHPFANLSFERVFTSNVYGLLREPERASFLSEVRRVGRELVLGEPTLRFSPNGRPEGFEERVLSDGSRHEIYRRYFDAEGLAKELGGQILFAGEWFSVVVARA